MKRILRPKAPQDDLHPFWDALAHIGEGDNRAIYPDKQQRHFEAEVKILRRICGIPTQEPRWKKLREDHSIKIRVSFADPITFGILLSPVAFFSLERLLGELSNEKTYSVTHPEESNSRIIFTRDQLLGCIGCLASSVLFLHEFNIRHKDLKTGNLLVYPSTEGGTGWKICLCDFATAYDYSDNPESRGLTTNDVFQPISNHVRAPEAFNEIARDISEDMWYLGCIFLEILLVSNDKTQADLLEIGMSE